MADVENIAEPEVIAEPVAEPVVIPEPVPEPVAIAEPVVEESQIRPMADNPQGLDLTAGEEGASVAFEQ